MIFFPTFYFSVLFSSLFRVIKIIVLIDISLLNNIRIQWHVVLFKFSSFFILPSLAFIYNRARPKKKYFSVNIFSLGNNVKRMKEKVDWQRKYLVLKRNDFFLFFLFQCLKSRLFIIIEHYLLWSLSKVTFFKKKVGNLVGKRWLKDWLEFFYFDFASVWSLD